MKKRTLFIILFLTLAVGVVRAQEGGQQFEGFNLQGYDEQGEKAWDVVGDTADIQGQNIKLTNVVANSYGEQQMNLKAKTGTIDKQNGNILLEKDVVITSEDGARLETDSLDWQKGNDLVTTNDPVKITRERMTAEGKGIRAHPNLKTAQLNEDVTVNIYPEPEQSVTEKVVITCDGPMEMDQTNNKAVFNENVVAVQEGGRELRTDKLELYFNPETNKIQELICLGNVVVIQGENRSYSERAVYKEGTKKLILYGRPKLILITEGDGAFGSFGN